MAWNILTQLANNCYLQCVTLEAPVLLNYLKAPRAVNLTAVWFINF